MFGQFLLGHTPCEENVGIICRGWLLRKCGKEELEWFHCWDGVGKISAFCLFGCSANVGNASLTLLIIFYSWTERR